MEHQEQKKNFPVNLKALLVEDNRIVQRVISAQLSNLGYEVTAANDALDAIKKIHDYQYNLIVTDLRLPDKPGNEVIKTARKSDANQGIPLIVSSAQINSADFKIYLDLGADAVLVKPFSQEELKKTIQHCRLMPYYQRKFFHQLKVCVQAFEENLKHPHSKEEFQLWIKHFQILLIQGLSVLQEYQQWFAFELQ